MAVRFSPSIVYLHYLGYSYFDMPVLLMLIAIPLLLFHLFLYGCSDMPNMLIADIAHVDCR